MFIWLLNDDFSRDCSVDEFSWGCWVEPGSLLGDDLFIWLLDDDFSWDCSVNELSWGCWVEAGLLPAWVEASDSPDFGCCEESVPCELVLSPDAFDALEASVGSSDALSDLLEASVALEASVDLEE